MLARLTVHFPFQPTRSFLIHGDGVAVVGRGEDCDIVLDDERVSRQHARFTFAGDAWRLSDLDSKNGTSLEGRPVREADLGREGWISFGGLLARFEHSSAERERALALRREKRWRTSISLQRGLSPSLGLERLLERLLGSVLALAEAERGFVLLRGADGEMAIAAESNLAEAELKAAGFSGSVGAIRRALRSARPVAVSDAQNDASLRGRESVVTGGIRSLVCIPLLAAERLIGVIYADSRQPGAALGELDAEILEALAGHAALAIAVAQVDRELQGLAAKLPAVASELAQVRTLVGGPAPETATSREGEPVSSWASLVAHHRARTGEEP